MILPSCQPGRYVYYNFADIGDHTIFSSHPFVISIRECRIMSRSACPIKTMMPGMANASYHRVGAVNPPAVIRSMVAKPTINTSDGYLRRKNFLLPKEYRVNYLPTSCQRPHYHPPGQNRPLHIFTLSVKAYE